MRLFYLKCGLMLIFVAIPITGMAQWESFGVKAGIQSAGVYSDISVDQRVIGYSAYGFADYRFTDHVSTTVELGISQRGFGNTQTETNAEGEFIQKVEAISRLTYLSLAPFVNLEVPLASWSPYVGLAPRLDYLMERSPGTFDFTRVRFQDPTVTGFDDLVFGTSLAVGIKEISIRWINIRLEARYEVDLSDSYSSYPREMRNNSLVGLIGISI